jgi:hypothetical protein
VVKELFVEYAVFGEVALVLATLTFAGLLMQLWLDRGSPRWADAARLPLDDDDRAREEDPS